MNSRCARCIVLAIVCLALAPLITGCGGGGCAQPSEDASTCATDPATDTPDAPDVPGPRLPHFCSNNPACI
jgi:hypothetical protein